jgi:ABC-type uncharacterized transport system involved in gliding motility auxiliary subunit
MAIFLREVSPMMTERAVRRYLALGILCAATAIALRFPARIDLTKNREHTLKPFTLRTLAADGDPIRITWYRTEMLARVSPEIRSIADALEEYRVAARGKLTYRVVDASAPGADAKPDGIGILPRQIDSGGQGGALTVYSGFLIECGPLSAVIPFVSGTETLEYDLTRNIDDLRQTASGRARRSVQLMIGSSGDAYGYVGPWLSYAGIETLAISPAAEAPKLNPSIPLIVIGSDTIGTGAVDAIASFCDSGGSIAFFVSGIAIETTKDWSASPKGKDALLEYLGTRGVYLQRNLVMDANCYRMTLPSLDNSRYQTVDYPYWVNVQTDRERLTLFWPSSLVTDVATMKPFAVSSDRTASAKLPFDTSPFSDRSAELSKAREPYVFSIRGSLGNAASRAIVVADERLPGSMNDFVSLPSNLDFFVSCAEWISGRDDLLSLKAAQGGLDKSSLTIDDKALRIGAIAQASAIFIFVALSSLLIVISGRKRR